MRSLALSLVVLVAACTSQHPGHVLPGPVPVACQVFENIDDGGIRNPCGRPLCADPAMVPICTGSPRWVPGCAHLRDGGYSPVGGGCVDSWYPHGIGSFDPTAAIYCVPADGAPIDAATLCGY